MQPVFRFPGKIKFPCVLTSPCGSATIAVIPGFAGEELCTELIQLCNSYGFHSEDTCSEYPQATVDLEVDSCPTIRDSLLQKDFVSAVKKSILSTHEASLVAFDDVFVVKYDASRSNDNAQRGLQLHHDRGDVSFILALSALHDYSGGGTYFDIFRYGKDFVNEDMIQNEAIHLNKGDLLVFDSALNHAGLPITRGTRYLLVGFCFVDKKGWIELPYIAESGCLDMNLQRME